MGHGRTLIGTFRCLIYCAKLCYQSLGSVSVCGMYAVANGGYCSGVLYTGRRAAVRRGPAGRSTPVVETRDHSLSGDKGIGSRPLYPVERPCSRPTAAGVVEVFEPVQRYRLIIGDHEPQCLVTEFTKLQRQIIKLLGHSPADNGR